MELDRVRGGGAGATAEGEPYTFKKRSVAGARRSSAGRHPEAKAEFMWQAQHKKMAEAIAVKEVRERWRSEEELDLQGSLYDSAYLVKEAYCQRKRELIDLYVRFLNVVRQDNIVDGHYFLDFSESASHKVGLMPGIVPSFLRHHYVAWVFKPAGKQAHFVRHLLGLEHLFILGAPRSINTEGISDVQLRKLAGNSMSVPVLEALFTLLLGSVDFSKPMSKHAPCTIHDCDVVSVDQGYHIATPMLARMKFDFPGLARRKTSIRTTVLTPWDALDKLPSAWVAELANATSSERPSDWSVVFQVCCAFFAQAGRKESSVAQTRDVWSGGRRYVQRAPS